jgi:hypothetical protein
MMGTLHEDVSTFLTISRKILLIMRSVLDKSCRENQDTYFMFSNFFSKIAQPKNLVETEGPRMMSQYGAYALHAG